MTVLRYAPSSILYLAACAAYATGPAAWCFLSVLLLMSWAAL